MIFSPLVSLLLLARGSNALAPRQYLPHAVQPPTFQTAASAEGDNWSVKEQDDSVCAAGSRHFAGRINVTDDKSMFFWFFESRNEEPRNDPVVIWLNGGPGASSLTGLYTEVGPCFINPDGQGTTKSGASWTEHANVLFIDQPAGVGLSTLANETEYPHNLATSSRDFLALLKIFYSEIFPQHDHNGLYIAGESYGGRFAPYYSAAILREQLEGSAGALQHVPLKGMVLVNAMVGSTWTSQGHYEMFCTDVPPNLVRFNDTTCRAMAAALPECERLSALCTTGLEPRVCEAAGMFCMENIYKYFDAEVQAHRRSTYDLRKDCPDPPLCGVGQNSSYGETSDFLNRRDVQKQLGFEQPIDFISINFDINMRFSLDPQIWVPTTPEVTYLLNGGVTGPAGQVDLNRSVSVLVLNGEYDVGW
ncbi:Alpha/Beta hydrolase protein [Dactylonectria macrodidyma]|uniref:Carboxypeptidase n=1 Tax=Dactylonectria macrodidyma TaxID=307937 RepID=A0A9P9EFP5_9HYPO|nr:Alpha/Beta hydrolase protein [Dactylonectria macrodidyma]